MAFNGPHHVSLYDVRAPAIGDAFQAEFTTPGVALALALNNGLAYVANHTAACTSSTTWPTTAWAACPPSA